MPSAPMLNPSTELEAVNRMLESIGQMPVSDVSVSGIPDVSDALRALRDTTRDTLAMGWSWNTDTGYTLQPNAEGYIELPGGYLDADPEDKTTNVTVRRNPATGLMSLYDGDNKTFVFTASVDVKIIWGFPFEDLPQPARTYIAVAAARRFQARKVSSSVLDRFNEEDEARAWNLVMRSERRNRDTNSFRNNAEAARMQRRRFG